MSVESELRAKIRPAEPTGAERSAISMVRAAMNIEDTLRDALRTMVAAANTYGTVALSADINNFVAGGAAWMATKYVEARQRLIDAGEDVSGFPPINQLPTDPPPPPVEE